jgi:tetratricopeptide (TPR) repeat protein
MPPTTSWQNGCLESRPGAGHNDVTETDTLRRILVAVLVLASGMVDSGVWAQSAMQCGRLASLENAYGPYDYTNPTHFRDRLPIVEKAHFTKAVENLVKARSGSLSGDLDYTLRAFPNHHRALYSLARYRLQYLANKENNRPFDHPAECYFERAIRFKPTDDVVHLIYAIFLHQRGETNLALDHYQATVRLNPDSAEGHYNIGLLYSDLEQYELAMRHATKAYKLGFPLQGLKNRLIKANVWEDPPEESSDLESLNPS